MNYLKIILFVFLGLSTSVLASIRPYFNHNPHSRYVDPYRNIYREGDNLEKIIIDEIKKARHSIYLAVQELRLPLVAKALIEKYHQGVDVRVILENNYNFSILGQRESSVETEYEASKLRELKALIDVNRDGQFSLEELQTRDAIYMIHQAKIPIMDDTFDSSRGSGLMHHKFMVIDGRSTIVSTANFTMSCIHGDMLSPSSRGNANSLILIESSSFAQIFTTEFSQLWGNGRRGNFGQNKTYRGIMTTVVDGAKISVQFSPTSRRYNWRESTNGLIASFLSRARHSIKAALFVFSDQIIADVMKMMAEKGIDVGVLIEPKFAFRYYSELLDLMGLQMLAPSCMYEPYNNPWRTPARTAGMAILSNGDVLHHKFAVVDNQTVVVGSQNWSDAANYTNDEFALVIESSEVAERFSREYDRVMQRSYLGPPAWLLERIRNQEVECSYSHSY